MEVRQQTREITNNLLQLKMQKHTAKVTPNQANTVRRQTEGISFIQSESNNLQPMSKPWARQPAVAALDYIFSLCLKSSGGPSIKASEAMPRW